MGKADVVIKCRNHFKNNQPVPSKDSFISKWVEMINRSEKNISIGLTKQ